MICPHCKKPIKSQISDEAKKRAKQLVKQGYSFRETEKILYSEGVQMSFCSISRMLKDKK